MKFFIGSGRKNISSSIINQLEAWYMSKFAIDILSQSYNATVFYFDNISFLEHVSNQLFLPNESSISQASLPHNGFNNLFPTVQEINHFTEVEWLKKK